MFSLVPSQTIQYFFLFENSVISSQVMEMRKIQSIRASLRQIHISIYSQVGADQFLPQPPSSTSFSTHRLKMASVGNGETEGPFIPG